jgi:anti-sigma-K factor RskA
MTDSDDIDMLAAEYVLGTLPAAERAAVALRSRHEKRLAEAIEAWERRLGPLAETIAPREAPAHVWPEIEARLDALAQAAERGASGARAEVIGIERRLRRWRAAAVAASALAASLMLFVGFRELTRPEQEKTLVAVLQKDGQSPAFLVSVDLEQRLLTIRAVAAEPRPGKSYELWLVHDELKTPRSLGVIGAGPFTVVRPTLASYSPQMIEQATLAVSLEPEGGSPTGAPTGPVLFAGKLIKATE